MIQNPWSPSEKKTIDPYPKRPRGVLQVLQESNLPRNSAANCRPRAKRHPLLFSCAWGDRVTAREAQENPKNFRRWCWRNWPRMDWIWHQVRTDCICLVMIVWHFSWFPQINWTIASNQVQEHTHKKTQGDITKYSITNSGNLMANTTNANAKNVMRASHLKLCCWVIEVLELLGLVAVHCKSQTSKD